MAQKKNGNSSRGGASKRGGSDDIQNMYKAIGVEGGSKASDRFDVDEVMEKARTYVNDQLQAAKDYAKEHPKAVLSGLAGIVIGAGALTAASIVKSRRAAAKKSAAKKAASKSSSSSKSSGAKKSSSKSSASKGSKSSSRKR
jgi:hypothetical protein